MNKIGNEKSILSTYIITTKTYALIPTRSTDHQTKVIEEDHTYYVNQSPLELIKLNCLLNEFKWRLIHVVSMIFFNHFRLMISRTSGDKCIRFSCNNISGQNTFFISYFLHLLKYVNNYIIHNYVSG